MKMVVSAKIRMLIPTGDWHVTRKSHQSRRQQATSLRCHLEWILRSFNATIWGTRLRMGTSDLSCCRRRCVSWRGRWSSHLMVCEFVFSFPNFIDSRSCYIMKHVRTCSLVCHCIQIFYHMVVRPEHHMHACTCSISKILLLFSEWLGMVVLFLSMLILVIDISNRRVSTYKRLLVHECTEIPYCWRRVVASLSTRF